MSNLTILISLLLITIVYGNMSCDSCGDECVSSCGSRRFRACCFNYLRKKRDNIDTGISKQTGMKDFSDLNTEIRNLNNLNKEIESLNSQKTGVDNMNRDMVNFDKIKAEFENFNNIKAETDFFNDLKADKTILKKPRGFLIEKNYPVFYWTGLKMNADGIH